MQLIRSLVFSAQIYFVMAIMALVFFPFALASRDAAIFACKTWCRWTIWSARWMIGLRTDIRGTPPSDAALIAAKHQSFFDIIMLVSVLPAPRFIMKRQLLWTPIVGQYALRIGCVPVDRGKRGQAIQKMLADVSSGLMRPGQLIIYPQGTRVAPGTYKPYKIGTAILYEQLAQDCVPVACNVGVFWPKRGLVRKPGTAVIEFLDPIAPGRVKEDVLTELESRIEARSKDLMAEAGFQDDSRPSP